MKQIVIFDMDGTLIDTAIDISITVNYVRRHVYGLEPLSQDYVVSAINSINRNLAELFYQTEIYESEAKKAFEEHYHDQCIQNVRPYEGIMETIQALHEHRCLLGVATNAPTPFAKRMLQHLNMAEYFHHIIGADAVTTPKPHPEMLHYHLDAHAYDATCDRAWMIGDNLKDIHAAKEAKIQSIFATWGFNENGEGDYIAHDPLEIARIILKD